MLLSNLLITLLGEVWIIDEIKPGSGRFEGFLRLRFRDVRKGAPSLGRVQTFRLYRSLELS